MEVRVATSIHEAGGNQRRGFEAMGVGQGLGSAASEGRRRKKKKWRRRRGVTGRSGEKEEKK